MARSRQVRSPGTACRAPTANRTFAVGVRMSQVRYKRGSPGAMAPGLFNFRRDVCRSNFGAVEWIRHHDGIATASPSSWCVCQFRHDRARLQRDTNYRCVSARGQYPARDDSARNPANSLPVRMAFGRASRAFGDGPGRVVRETSTRRAPTADSSSSEVSHCPKPCLWDNGTAQMGICEAVLSSFVLG